MLCTWLLSALCWFNVIGHGWHSDHAVQPYAQQPLQNLVTWDEHSLFVRGERIMIFSGEFHPFRLPVPDLWLDIFQKLKSAGFSAVSFYTHWALLEGKPGNFSTEGIFALEPFFEAASEAGIYLIARPGPYINAEVTGGGFPGWLQRAVPAGRTRDFLPYTENYVQRISEIIKRAQITHGGPIILFQPENEYTYGTANVSFPDASYFQEVQDMYRRNGIVVPMISNDAGPYGNNAPGTGKGSIDIYGHDGYPLGFDCSNPYEWPDGALPTNYSAGHLAQSPSTPYTIVEFQGGAFDPWGGVGLEKCATLINEEFERVFYKNNYAAAISIFSLYMGFGGTNWGSLGHPGGYTSYDYGAIITEDRLTTRQKYSEAKLQANFFRAVPEYLTATSSYANDTVNGFYVDNPSIAVTKLTTNTTTASKETSIYIVRHAAYNSRDTTQYRLTIPWKETSLTVPELGGHLTLNGRDSKMHVVDLDMGDLHLDYSTAEVFTWKKYGNRTVLLVYGDLNETHELRFYYRGHIDASTIMESTGVTSFVKGPTLLLSWVVGSARDTWHTSWFTIYLLNRHEAYNYWVIDLPRTGPVGNYTAANPNSIIAKAGYLVRTAIIDGGTLNIIGDVNATTDIEIVGGATRNTSLLFNGKSVETTFNDLGAISGTIQYIEPALSVPTLRDLPWKYIDSLPEIQSSYNDSAWVAANRTASKNTKRNLTTPVSLYSSDYGFHTSNLLTRGHFNATGSETYFFLETWGGYGYASAVFLDDMQLDGFPGSGANSTGLQNMSLPKLVPSQSYYLTVLTDNMGLEEDFIVGGDTYKNPRGVVEYRLGGRDQSAISWKIAGNLGGEDYRDRTRGPLNEGGLWAERQGYHLPKPPSEDWELKSPFARTEGPGVAFYTTDFELDMPEGYDIPMSFAFANSTGENYRAQLYVNGYQFGKYVNNIGPQTSFPVPEGILDYHGTNYVALSLWSFDEAGNGLGGLELRPTAKIMTGSHKIRNAPMPAWERREGAY